MLEAIDIFSCILAGVIAPSLLLLSVFYRRRFRQVSMAWRMPQFTVITILVFILNLTLFVLGCLFLAVYLGTVRGIPLSDFPPHVLMRLGINCFLLVAATTMLYFGLKPFFTQYVTTQGIAFDRLDILGLKRESGLLHWRDIADYYLHADYPVTVFNLLVRGPDATIQRVALRVPFYAKSRFESLLDSSMESHRFRKAQSEHARRNISSN